MSDSPKQCCSALLIECIACIHKEKPVAFFQLDLLPPLFDGTGTELIVSTGILHFLACFNYTDFVYQT
jgi:hypothetical protein